MTRPRRKPGTLKHTNTHRTCYACERFLLNSEFTWRKVGTPFSGCKDCNKIWGHLRRVLEKEAGPRPSTKDILEKFQTYDSCIICKKEWKDVEVPENRKYPWVIDHIIPLNPRPGEPKGSNDLSNLQPLCSSCNSIKGNRPMEMFL